MKTQNVPIRAWIGNLGEYNEGYLDGIWVDFPADEDELKEAMKKIHIGDCDSFGCVYEEVFIADYETEIDGIADVLSEYTPIKNINQLAEALDGLQDWEVETLEAALQLESVRNVADAIGVIEHLDEYDFYPDINTCEDLGRYYADEGCIDIPEELQRYFDFDAYGRDIYYSDCGIFTDSGYIVRY